MVFVFLREQSGGGDGDGFVAGGEECPAVGGAFGDVEGFAGLEAAQDGEVVDGAVGALGELEARGGGSGKWKVESGKRAFGVGAVVVEVSVLDADEVAVLGVVGDLEPVDAVAVVPGGEAAPADDAGVEAALVEEEVAGGGREVGAGEEAGVAGGVEGLGVTYSFPPLGDSPYVRGRAADAGGGETAGHSGAVGEPGAGFGEGFVEEVHDEVDGAAVGVADEAAVGVAAGVEGE